MIIRKRHFPKSNHFIICVLVDKYLLEIVLLVLIHVKRVRKIHQAFFIIYELIRKNAICGLKVAALVHHRGSVTLLFSYGRAVRLRFFLPNLRLIKLCHWWSYLSWLHKFGSILVLLNRRSAIVMHTLLYHMLLVLHFHRHFGGCYTIELWLLVKWIRNQKPFQVLVNNLRRRISLTLFTFTATILR